MNAGPIIALAGSDLKTVTAAFKYTRMAHIVRVWFDPIDGGVKFKFDNGTWSPPLGRIE